MDFKNKIEILKVMSFFIIAIALFVNGLAILQNVKVKRNEVAAMVFLSANGLRSPLAMELIVTNGLSLEETLDHMYSVQYPMGNKSK